MPRHARAFVTSLAALGLLLMAGLATVPAALAGGGCHAGMSGAVHTDGTASVVRMDVCSFEPTVARVPVGTEVTFLNTSNHDHVVLGRGQSWGSGDPLRPGASRAARFGEAGVFPYSCPLHPGMVGTIVVGDANTPLAVMGADAGGGVEAADAGDVSQAGSGGTATAAGGLEPVAAIGIGGVAGLTVIALGALAVRRRPGSAPIAD
jgi:plastocyanin